MCFAERRQKQPARDAAGAALGCFGLAGFALVCWLCLPRIDTAAVFALAIFVWLALAATAWLLRKSRLFRHARTDERGSMLFAVPNVPGVGSG